MWRIYYADGSTFDSEAGTWAEAPAWGIQAIIREDPRVGWAMVHGGDYYVMGSDGVPIGVDLAGLFDYVANVLGAVKVGRMLSRVEYAEVYQAAKRDLAELKQTGFVSRKTGFLRRERRPD